ncbi:HTH_48 domain-containing protein [Trichonephila clavipes]|nr:HTH_48 domain-containing protein [Trichonephila clavipes]
METLISSPAASEVRSVMKFLNAESIAPIEIHRQLCQVYWLNIMSKQMVRRWCRTATAGSDVVQSGSPIFDDFFQHLWPYIGNNTENVVFQMVKRL